MHYEQRVVYSNDEVTYLENFGWYFHHVDYDVSEYEYEEIEETTIYVDGIYQGSETVSLGRRTETSYTYYNVMRRDYNSDYVRLRDCQKICEQIAPRINSLAHERANLFRTMSRCKKGSIISGAIILAHGLLFLLVSIVSAVISNPKIEDFLMQIQYNITMGLLFGLSGALLILGLSLLISGIVLRKKNILKHYGTFERLTNYETILRGAYNRVFKNARSGGPAKITPLEYETHNQTSNIPSGFYSIDDERVLNSNHIRWRKYFEKAQKKVK